MKRHSHDRGMTYHTHECSGEGWQHYHVNGMIVPRHVELPSRDQRQRQHWRTDQQIDEQADKAREMSQTTEWGDVTVGLRSHWPKLTYEDGVCAALDWVRGYIEDKPMEDTEIADEHDAIEHRSQLHLDES